MYLDAYDSFSNNIVSQVEQCLDADVTSIHIDDPAFYSADGARKPTSFTTYLKSFDGVIAGPGPGWADKERDVGLIQELWKLENENLLPVLGICLGFQSLALAFGANIERLAEPRHGLVAEILHKGKSIFTNVDELFATQYHSLYANIGHSIQTKRAVSYPGELWKPTKKCPELEPLAWDFDNKKNGAALMAVQHTTKPFYGVQFHPESICTNDQGSRLIQNWWAAASTWNRKRQYETAPTTTSLSPPVPTKNSSYGVASTVANLIAHGDGKSLLDLPPEIVHCATTGSGRLTVADVCELFNIPRNEAIVLESGLQPNLLPMGVGTGRYSIIGLIIPQETLRLHYYTATRLMKLCNDNGQSYWEGTVQDPWEFLKTVTQNLKPSKKPKGPTFAPFWGGFMGYVSYEAGLDTINVDAKRRNTGYPDICFAYLTRSIVFDHQVKKVYVQSIRGKDDKAWVSNSLEQIYEAVGRKSRESSPNHTPMPQADPFETDADLIEYISSCQLLAAEDQRYCQRVVECKEFIADGQSYELCLTVQNEIRAKRPDLAPEDNNVLSWKLYKNLTRLNPAPFSAYLRLHNLHVLSSSPERYISWDRNQVAQCRPIKGTVRKAKGVTRDDAMAILSSSKERAENLMIVDLVRHQLHGVYGSGNVNVSQLMEVEEYETLWQLVSVVDAIPGSMQKPGSPEEWEDPIDYVSGKVEGSSEEETLGFDAFVKSLPPGSMTGAPKKRSCQILQSIEEHEPRGLYAGVLGYLDVGGGGDFSVVIRTAVKVDNDDNENNQTSPSDATTNKHQDEEIWKIGAGGAVTSQSTPQGETEEMSAKFSSTARAFQHIETPSSTTGNKDREKLSETALNEMLARFRPPTTMMMQTHVNSVNRTVHDGDGGEGVDGGGL